MSHIHHTVISIIFSIITSIIINIIITITVIRFEKVISFYVRGGKLAKSNKNNENKNPQFGQSPYRSKELAESEGQM